jgi:hypothetical protein
MTDLYERYARFVREICQIPDLSFFKSRDEYTYMLEHVTPSEGKAYLDLILRVTPITEDMTSSFCKLNDSLGNPQKTDYSCGLVSPSNLRYIFQSHLILSHIEQVQENEPVDLVELGGGYGGLCLALHFFAPLYKVNIRSYSIVDLPEIIILQNLYLGILAPHLRVKFYESTRFGADIPVSRAFFVSNYAFSEIPMDLQKQYIKYLFPKISHGFITWNAIPVYEFGFPLQIREEQPQTSKNEKNHYVTF